MVAKVRKGKPAHSKLYPVNDEEAAFWKLNKYYKSRIRPEYTTDLPLRQITAQHALARLEASVDGDDYPVFGGGQRGMAKGRGHTVRDYQVFYRPANTEDIEWVEYSADASRFKAKVLKRAVKKILPARFARMVAGEEKPKCSGKTNLKVPSDIFLKVGKRKLDKMVKEGEAGKDVYGNAVRVPEVERKRPTKVKTVIQDGEEIVKVNRTLYQKQRDLERMERRARREGVHGSFGFHPRDDEEEEEAESSEMRGRKRTKKTTRSKAKRGKK